MNKKKIIIIYFLFFALKFSWKNSSKKSKDNDFKKIEIFYILCNKGILLNKNFFKRNNNPKISIISPIYNKEKYLLRFLRSVQNQFFDDIEIIVVDDHSTDHSLEIIEKLIKTDERIILIKNKKNKRTLISRNNGALKSRGEYLIFPDPDDILSDDILNYCYVKAKIYSYDLIKFNLYSGSKVYNLKKIKRIKNKDIYQKELILFILILNNSYLLIFFTDMDI